jgi:hypothetical protein
MGSQKLVNRGRFGQEQQDQRCCAMGTDVTVAHNGEHPLAFSAPAAESIEDVGKSIEVEPAGKQREQCNQPNGEQARRKPFMNSTRHARQRQTKHESDGGKPSESTAELRLVDWTVANWEQAEKAKSNRERAQCFHAPSATAVGATANQERAGSE